jgi:antitoxin component YwqK of YwqJK toxin-antitoxin module
MNSNGIVKTYYDIEKTQIYQEYYQLNGSKEGEYKVYDTHGQVWILCTYINNILEGKHIEYCLNGQVKKISTFINGKKYENN